MGQYYLAILLGPTPGEHESNEFIRACVSANSYGNGAKLMEHSYLNNKYVSAVEWLLSPKGHFWKSRLVWTGDYADPEHHVAHPDGTLVATNLYEIAGAEQAEKDMVPESKDMSSYCYLVNHTKKQYVDKSKAPADTNGFRIHPLPLLTAEGNGRGGGDYHGAHEMLVGSWARDVISVEKSPPQGYELIQAEFFEGGTPPPAPLAPSETMPSHIPYY